MTTNTISINDCSTICENEALTLSDILQNIVKDSGVKMSDECDNCEYQNDCSGEVKVTGSTLKCIDDDLCLVYLDENNNYISYIDLMPDIINVQNPNDKTVFVEFADGSKEVARLNEGDTFSLETGILICIVKKMFSDMDIFGTGSSVYNKVIKYALTKLDYTKKLRQEILRQQKAERMAIVNERQEHRRRLNKEREERIKEMSEAYKRAIMDISESSSKDIKKAMDDIILEINKEIEKYKDE